MNKIEILNEIDNKCEELENEKKISSKEYSQIRERKEFFEKDNFSIKIYNEDISLYKYFALYMRSKSKNPLDIPLDLENEKIISSNLYYILKKFAEDFVENKESQNNNRNFTRFSNNTVYLKNTNDDSVSNYLVDAFNKNDYEMLLGLMTSETELFLEARDFIAKVDAYKEFIDRMKTEHGTSRKSRKFTSLVLSEANKEYGLDIDLNYIQNYYARLEQIEKKKKVYINKAISKYNKLKSYLEKLADDKPITNLAFIIDSISDEDFQIKVLDYVYSHNLNIYEKLKFEYSNLSEQPDLKIKLLLSKYNIFPSNYSLEDFINMPIEKIESMFKLLTEMNLADVNVLLYIVKLGDLETITLIKKLYDKKIISTKFLLNNKEVFNRNSICYINVFKNIDILTDFKIPLYYLYQNQELLLIDTLKLITNLKILDEYGLINCIKSSTNLNFINKTNLENLIDKIIELGFSKILIRNLNLLNYQEEKWNRILILKKLEFENINEKKLIKTLDEDVFIIRDENLDEYTFTFVPTNIDNKINSLKGKNAVEEPEQLKEYKINSLCYNIDGVLCSRIKVLRNLSKLDDVDIPLNEKMFLSIINNSNLDEEEYCYLYEKYLDNQKYIKI